MNYSEYKKLTNEEKELWNFEAKVNQSKKIGEILEHSKRTNGRISKLELWRSMIVGALVILGVLLPYLSFII